MSNPADPAEQSPMMRRLYRNWRPTPLARALNRFYGWYSAAGLPPRWMVAVTIRGRTSGQPHTTVLVVPEQNGNHYLVSMLGEGSGWVKNARANPDATIRHGRQRSVRLVEVPPAERAPVIRENVRIASSGRRHFPVQPGALLSEFEAIADRYPVFRIEPRQEP
jgi:deazaflavin-dependent oxidoreductase (nitroreductase family)